MEEEKIVMEEFIFGRPSLSLIPRAFFVELLREMQEIFSSKQ